MRPFQIAGACDCHSHVFGPFAKFPLCKSRSFDPPESPIADLAHLWSELGIERAVLVQGSAHGNDPSALVEAILLSPATRRGVVLLHADVSAEQIAFLHSSGVRAVRFNWIRHLLASDARTQQARLSDAEEIVRRVAPYGWHVEVHIDIEDLELAEKLVCPGEMPIVIDHMARIDVSSTRAEANRTKLLRLLEQERFWVKISGADRLAAHCTDLADALATMQAIIRSAPDRCVWGLDWPHVNLGRKRPDAELVDFIQETAGDTASLARILVANPARLYSF